jgi:TctA family transporter
MKLLFILLKAFKEFTNNLIMLILDFIFGLFFGFIIGLIPNLHLNVISYFFILLGIFNYNLSICFFISFIISNSIANFIPINLFGIPNTNNLFVLFPSHKLFQKGYAKKSIFISLLASNYSLLFSLLFLPLLYVLFTFLGRFSFFITLSLIFILFLFVFQEKTLKSKLIVFSIIIYCGALGISTLKYSLIKFPLLIIMFGLFAMPQLLISIKSNNFILQKKDIVFPKIKNKFALSFLGAFSSLFILLLPTFSSSQASLIVTKIKTKLSSIQYIFIYSLINISSIIFCIFLALFFNKSRLGFISILLEQRSLFTNINYIYVIIFIILSVLISCLLVYFLIDLFLDIFNKINIKILNICLILFTTILILFLTKDLLSLFFLVLSSLIGFLPILYNKNRVILISYLIIPTLIYYIF